MPSKRKKNKRRMRRVQAQRRALEEQHSAHPPVKTSPGIPVSAPPSSAPKKAAKTTARAPEVIPKAVPKPAPVAEILRVDPNLVAAEPALVKLESSEPDGIPQHKPPTEGQVQPTQETDVEAPKEPEATSEPSIDTSLELEVSAPTKPQAEAPSELEAFTEPEAPLNAPDAAPAETPSVGSGYEAETVINEAEPVTEAILLPDETPEVVQAETEIPSVDTVVTETSQAVSCEHEQKYSILQPVAAAAPEEVEVTAAEQVSASEPDEEPTEKPEVLSSELEFAEAELIADEIDAAPREKPVAEILEPQKEILSPAGPAEEGEKGDEEEAAVQAELFRAVQDAPVHSVKVPVVPETIPEVLLEEAEAAVIESKEADNSAVTESATAAEDSAEAAVRLGVVGTGGALQTQTEPPAEQAAEIIAAGQTCADVSPEEAESGVRDISSHTELTMDSVQLSLVETPVEMTVNGNIVPEVSIEG